jgi:hypothetical protein
MFKDRVDRVCIQNFDWNVLFSSVSPHKFNNLHWSTVIVQPFRAVIHKLFKSEALFDVDKNIKCPQSIK